MLHPVVLGVGATPAKADASDVNVAQQRCAFEEGEMRRALHRVLKAALNHVAALGVFPQTDVHPLC